MVPDPQSPSLICPEPTSSAIEIVKTICIGGGPGDDAGDYVDLVAVTFDETEEQLIRQLHSLSHEVASRCGSAATRKDPKLIARDIDAAIPALKSMLDLIRALNHHRHGSIQRVRIHNGDEPPKTNLSKLAHSDSLLEELFLAGVKQLSEVGEYCKRQRLYLGKLLPEQFIQVTARWHVSTDPQITLSQLESLESKVLTKSSSFTAAIIKARPKEQLVLISRSAPMKKTERRKKPRAVVPSAPVFAIGVNIEKARLDKA